MNADWNGVWSDLQTIRLMNGLTVEITLGTRLPPPRATLDHTPFDDSPRSTALCMSGAEQQQALMDAPVAIRGGLVLYVGERDA